MTQKENKGGNLTNEEVEQDLKAKGRTEDNNEAYVGSQDNGDKRVSQPGTDLQRADGRLIDEENKQR